MIRRPARLLAALAVVTGVVVVTPAVASAHPLGNFSINTYAGLRIADDRLAVDYVLDLAEIPTLQQGIDPTGDGAATCRRMAAGLEARFDGRPVRLAVRSSALTSPPGQAGLATTRLECRLRGRVDARRGEHRLEVRDANYGNRIGWHELTAVGDGTTLTGSALPTTSISARLTRYPEDRLESPLDTRRATLRVSPGGAAAPAPVPETVTGSVVRGFDDLTASLTSSVAARRLTLGLALVALAVGIGLGALHAVAPGHGKTVMAAYLVGENGSARHGLVIGLTVALTHTVGVLALGLALTLSQTLAPESIYPWLGVASGVCFVALGMTLLWRAVQRRRGIATSTFLSHSHGFGHEHTHGGTAHDHDHRHHHEHENEHEHDHTPVPAMSRRDLITLGIAGGMVPTPTAVVVLLGATAIGRAWFGVFLVLAYGLGMAATLVAAGLLLAWARHRFELRTRGERMMRLATVIPIATAIVVTVSGLWLVAKAAAGVV
jgi:ABC-type nickel/cobalt efflux system permease component RcnA